MTERALGPQFQSDEPAAPKPTFRPSRHKDPDWRTEAIHDVALGERKIGRVARVKTSGQAAWRPEFAGKSFGLHTTRTQAAATLAAEAARRDVANAKRRAEGS